jgi:two-component system, OmpR family, sensor histidine kinase VicK
MELTPTNVIAFPFSIEVSKTMLPSNTSVLKSFVEADQLKRDFSTLISHELRSPLTSISCILAGLAEGQLGALNDLGQEQAKQALLSLKRLLNLINDLLDINRLGAGEFDIRYSSVNIQEVLELAALELSAWALSKSVALKLDATAHEVTIDPDRIRQVVINLLSNAIKFSSPHSTISITAVAKNGQIEVRVNDQGPGLYCAPNEARIGNRADKKSEHGAGLGLRISRGIVAGHGGHLGAENLLEGGASFWFTIPIAPSTSSAEPTDQLTSPLPSLSLDNKDSTQSRP